MWTLTLSSIYYDCRIINSEIEYSIVMENSEIIDVGTRIDRSILGGDVKIKREDVRPKTQVFIVGNHSFIKLV